MTPIDLIPATDAVDALVSKYGMVENATLVDTPPLGEYAYELKYDGYRMLAFKSGTQVKLISRRGQDWTSEFREIADALSKLAAREVVLDGEIVAPDEHGAPSFQRLQNRQGRLVYIVFDLLQLDGEDQRARALSVRRSALERALGTPELPLALSPTLRGDVPDLLKAACDNGFEGLIGKRVGSAYVRGRTLDWIKLKCQHRQEFAIIGYLPYAGTQHGVVGSLLLAVRQSEHFVFCGKVGTGFDLATRRDLGKRLEEHNTRNSPVRSVPKFGGLTRFNELGPVCEVRFSEWTAGGNIRHGSYMGLRPDKRPEDCVREATSSDASGTHAATHAETGEAMEKKDGNTPIVRGVRISHPERVLSPMPITKLELVRYYESVGEWMLPHVQGRPLTLVRWSENASEKGGTYLRHAKAWGPLALRRVKIREQKKTGEYLFVDDVVGPIGLAQMDIVEIHTWNSTDDDLERPNRVVFDLDPDPSVEWNAVIEAARSLRAVLRGLGLESWLKTTGGKGLHLVVPILPEFDWATCHTVTREIATRFAASDPKRYVASVPKARRHGKILIDYLRNNRGSTSVAAFSTRANTQATVSTPIHWDELTTRLSNDQFTLYSVPKRLAHLTVDPWADYWQSKQRLLAGVGVSAPQLHKAKAAHPVRDTAVLKNSR